MPTDDSSGYAFEIAYDPEAYRLIDVEHDSAHPARPTPCLGSTMCPVARRGPTRKGGVSAEKRLLELVFFSHHTVKRSPRLGRAPRTERRGSANGSTPQRPAVCT